jgi:predicted MFS family arabinose efflux permease
MSAPGSAKLRRYRKFVPLAAAIHAFCISGVSFQLVPLLIGKLGADLALSTAQVGAIPSSELAGVTLANLVGAWLIRTVSWNVLVTLGWALWIAGNAAAATSSVAITLLTLRFLVGIGAGLLSAVSTAALARSSSPERAFAVTAVAQALLGAACTLATPSLLALGSWMAVYGLLSLLGLPGLLLRGRLAGLAVVAPAKKVDTPTVRTPSAVMMFLGPAGVLLSYVAMSMVWTYYGQMGASAGLSTDAIAGALSVGAVTVLVVSLFVTAVGSRLPRTLALMVSMFLTSGAVWMAFASSGPWLFTASVVVWTCGTGIFTPYAFAATAVLDPSGSSTALASALSGAGMALGPILAAPFIASGGVASVRWLAPAFLVLGFVAFVVPLRIRQTGLGALRGDHP